MKTVAGFNLRPRLTPKRFAVGVGVAAAVAALVIGLRNKDPYWMAAGLFVTLFSAILWALNIVMENSDLRADNERQQSRINELSAAYARRIAERDRAYQPGRDLEAVIIAHQSNDDVDVAAGLPRPEEVS